MNAVLQEEEDVSIPWSQYSLCHLGKAVLPSWCLDYVLKLLVGWDAMRLFHGREA